jgi:hypothetical protein
MTYLFHIELIRLLVVACEMLSHSSLMTVKSCRILVGTGTPCRTRQSRAFQTCSMGDMSGEYAGHGTTGTCSVPGIVYRSLRHGAVHYHAETWGDGSGWIAWQWALEGEHLPTQVSHDTELQSGQDLGEYDEHADELSWDFFLTVCAEMIWLCKPTVSSAFQVAVLRWSRRWGSQMWRSWAGVVTRGLWLWGRLDILPNSLKCLEAAYGREINIQISGNISGGHSCSQHANCMLPQNLSHLWHCVVCKTAHFRVALYCSKHKRCAMSMVFNQLLDMPHLSGGWIILAKSKYSLTGM